MVLWAYLPVFCPLLRCSNHLAFTDRTALTHINQVTQMRNKYIFAFIGFSLLFCAQACMGYHHTSPSATTSIENWIGATMIIGYGLIAHRVFSKEPISCIPITEWIGISIITMAILLLTILMIVDHMPLKHILFQLLMKGGMIFRFTCKTLCP